MSFNNINFGRASAEAEARENPELLLRGYYDYGNVSRKLENEKEWLVLGYKGSGKSAIGERMRLRHLNNPNVFVNNINIGDFEYIRFSNVIKSKEAIETKLPSAWSWILYAFLLNSFFKDESVSVSYDNEYAEIKESFRVMGLLPLNDLSTIVNVSSEENFRLSIPKYAEKKWTKKSEYREVDIRWYIYNIRPFISNIRSSSFHYLVLDGLDDILTNSKEQYTAIGALIFEINRVNSYMKECGVPAKIIVMCRTDIFELLAGANKNKIRQDYSIDLDWNTQPNKPDVSLLIEIANIRGSLSLKRKVDIFKDYFPKKIFSKGIRKYMLDMTRHTPRDFLQLLRYVQLSNREERISDDELKNSFREYSSKYFLPEVHDELGGYVPPIEIRNAVDAIGQIRSRDFSKNDLIDAARKTGWDMHTTYADIILHALYECSAIGNVRPISKGIQKFYLSYKYRNRHSNLKIDERMILHRGLWRAFNLELTSFGEGINPDITGR